MKQSQWPPRRPDEVALERVPQVDAPGQGVFDVGVEHAQIVSGETAGVGGILLIQKVVSPQGDFPGVRIV